MVPEASEKQSASIRPGEDMVPDAVHCRKAACNQKQLHVMHGLYSVCVCVVSPLLVSVKTLHTNTHTGQLLQIKKYQEAVTSNNKAA